MIPYFPQPVLEVFGQRIAAFTITETIAVLSFLFIAERIARRKGLPSALSFSMAGAALLLGGIGSYLVMLLAYHPEIAFSGDWNQIAGFDGQSSTGAQLGGFLMAWVVTRRYWSVDQCLRFQDSLVPAWMAALMIGRIGCFLAHEHLGIQTAVWFAVDFPTGPQLDMGLIELVLLLPIVVAIFFVDRKSRVPGTTLAFGFACHGLLRFFLDFWRVGEMTYFGLTPAQYLSVGFVATAIGIHHFLRQSPRMVGELNVSKG